MSSSPRASTSAAGEAAEAAEEEDRGLEGCEFEPEDLDGHPEEEEGAAVEAPGAAPSAPSSVPPVAPPDGGEEDLGEIFRTAYTAGSGLPDPQVRMACWC